MALMSERLAQMPLLEEQLADTGCAFNEKAPVDYYVISDAS